MSARQATVHRLRPRNGKLRQALQETLDFGGWSEPTRVELNQRLTAHIPDPLERWSYTMVAASAETVAAFLKEVMAGPRAFSTLRVWYAILPYVRKDTGELLCTQRTLAQTAMVSRGDVQRALARLVEMGALVCEERGHYRVHPRLLWKGELAKREVAETRAPRLRLLEPAGS